MDFNGSGGDSVPTCPPNITVKACYLRLFDSAIGNSYFNQGIQGVRFQFTVGGGYGSQVWTSSGQVRADWVGLLQQFLLDLRSSGVKRVTPTPMLYGTGDDDTQFKTPDAPVSNCTGDPLRFYKWMPFGLRANGDEDCRENNYAYYQAVRSNHFWGWTPYVAMWREVFKAIRLADLEVGNIDLSNELELEKLTVQARWIYDCAPSQACFDTLRAVRSAAAAESVDSWSITFSTPARQPQNSSSGYTCNSAYGSTALLIATSALIAAMDGKSFGIPSNYSNSNFLRCGGDSVGMIILPKAYDRPRVLDAHIYPCFGCVRTSPDVTALATSYYSGMRDLMNNTGYRSARAVIGETHSGVSCFQDGLEYTPLMASQSVQGYRSSSLFAQRGAQTILRPWYVASDFATPLCYVCPGILVPPYQFP